MKSYGFKNICEIDVYDYIDLKNNPLFLKIDEKDKSFQFGISLRYYPTKGYIKVTSIQEIERELRKHNFVYKKNTEKILRYIQTQLYP